MREVNACLPARDYLGEGRTGKAQHIEECQYVRLLLSARTSTALAACRGRKTTADDVSQGPAAAAAAAAELQ